MIFNIEKLDGQFVDGIKLLSDFYGFTLGNGGVTVTAEPCEEGYGVEKTGNTAVLRYSQKTLFFTAFSHLMQRYGEDFSLQKPHIGRLGIMRDCARNGIMSEKGFRETAIYCAMMGYTYFELYGEDLLEIPEYPYLGINRGRYSKEELRRMDEYAQIFGIELVPCIQTLAHLPHIFRHDAFAEINDMQDILLVDDEKTYAFIDAVIGFCAEAFTSRHINIGMDEAHMLGFGRYMQSHGFPADRTGLFLKHLNRVLEICRKYGFQPSMWSDMIFKVAMDIHVPQAYVGMEGKTMDKAFVESFPKDVTLIFWDYYNFNQDFYDDVFRRHFEITDNVSFAGGVWTWQGFTPFNTMAEAIIEPQVASILKNSCKDVLMTAWGDGGGDCLLWTAASTLLFTAEKLSNGGDRDELNARALTIFGNTYDDLKAIEEVEKTREDSIENTVKNHHGNNPTKYLLFNDPLCGVLDAHVYPELKEMFARNAAEMKAVADKNGKLARYFESMYRLARCVEVKATLGVDITAAYKAGDKEALLKIAQERIPECLARFEQFADYYKKLWLTENKRFGFEVNDIRFGTVKKRLAHAKERIEKFARGEVERIEELEQKRQPIASFMKEKEDLGYNSFYWNTTCSLL